MIRKIYIKKSRIIQGLILSAILLSNCSVNSMQGMVIFTLVNPEALVVDSLSGGNWRYPENSKIVAVDQKNPGKITKYLTHDFYSARSPEISFDGKKMLFAGQKKQGDPWQIYELTFANNHIRQVIVKAEDCTDPAYLPGHKIVFSSRCADELSQTGHVLYTAGNDGCCLKRITFHPHSEFAATVLQDGRLMVISWQTYPVTGRPRYMSFRPDGTKTELYYQGETAGWYPGKARETLDGQVVFIESASRSMDDGKLLSLDRGRPLSSRKELSGNIEGDFYSVFPRSDGKLIVSYSEPGQVLFGIYEFDPVSQKIGDRIYLDSGFSSIEPVIIAPHQLPRDLPSEVLEEKKTGLLMCMNSDNSYYPASKDEKTERIRIIGLEGLINEIPVEEDGSFYLDITADSPVRLITLGKSGEILRGPCSWIYMRPNERRGCIGCHEDHELAPENIVVGAIRKMPVEVVVPDPGHAEAGNKGSYQN